jgi:hypothetical protein
MITGFHLLKLLTYLYSRMKKVFASLMVLVYLTVSTGFTVSMHYCMDRFDSAQLGTSGSDKCGKCGMTKHAGCCHDVIKVVKLETSHVSTPAINPGFSAPAALPATTDFLYAAVQNDISSHSFITEHGPPLLSGQNIYLQNCVFRI